jgi:tetratricopeptide (TPR) repeat protein
MVPSAHQEALIGQEEFSHQHWAGARDHFVEAIRLDPDHAEYHFAAAMCDWAGGQVDEAGDYLRTAVRLEPGLARAQAWLGEWYLIHGITDAALKATATAIALDPADASFMLSRAWVLEAAGDLDGAWELVGQLIGRMEMNSSLARLYGRLACRYGQEAPALAAITGLLATGPGSDAAVLHFAAAQLLDRLGRYDEAFDQAAAGNALRQGTGYKPAAEALSIDRLINYFTRQRLAALPRATLRSDKPVFIVGMPRSGTSLVEQILASHPQVHGAGELDFIHRILLGTADMLHANLGAYPACLDHLTTAQADGLAEVYLAPFIAMRPDAARITDKMPSNFVHLGLIALLFPQARIIHCHRDPMDTCLSCFVTQFNQGYEFTHDLKNLGHFYRLYARLMAHWKRVIDLPILDVSYEQMVANPEAQSRRMVEFVGLPWDDRCLNFHETKRPCVTSSVVQVRRPMYATSVGRWKFYAKHLEPLKAALGDSVDKPVDQWPVTDHFLPTEPQESGHWASA